MACTAPHASKFSAADGFPYTSVPTCTDQLLWHVLAGVWSVSAALPAHIQDAAAQPAALAERPLKGTHRTSKTP